MYTLSLLCRPPHSCPWANYVTPALVTFDATSVSVRHNHACSHLTWQSPPLTGLWHLGLDIPVSRIPPTAPTARRLSHDMVHSSAQPWLLLSPIPPLPTSSPSHMQASSPALSTIKIALDRGFLPDIQGLTAKALANKCPPMSVPMIKGHYLDQPRRINGRRNVFLWPPRGRPPFQRPPPTTTTTTISRSSQTSPSATQTTHALTTASLPSLNQLPAKSTLINGPFCCRAQHLQPLHPRVIRL